MERACLSDQVQILTYQINFRLTHFHVFARERSDRGNLRVDDWKVLILWGMGNITDGDCRGRVDPSQRHRVRE